MRQQSIRRFSIAFIVIIGLVMAFVLAFSLDTYAASVPTAKGQVNSETGAVLRKSSSTTSEELDVLDDDTKVVITKEVFKKKSSTSKKNKWYYVTVGDKKGYIRSDLIDGVTYSAVAGKINGKTVYRKGAGTKMKKAGTLKKGTAVTVYLTAKPLKKYKGSSKTWYRIKVGKKYYFVPSNKVDLVGSIFVNNTTADAPSLGASAAIKPMTDSEFEAYLTQQGFPEDYKVKLRALHKAHPNWRFIAFKTNVEWKDAVAKETKKGISAIHESLPKSYRSTAKYSANAYVPEQTSEEAAEVAAGVLYAGSTVDLTKAKPAAEQAAEVTESDCTETLPSEPDAAEAPVIESNDITPEEAAETMTDDDPETLEAEIAADAACDEGEAEQAEAAVQATALDGAVYRAYPDITYPEAGVFEEGETVEVFAFVKEEAAESTETSAAAEDTADDSDICDEIWYLTSVDGNTVYINKKNLAVEEEFEVQIKQAEFPERPETEAPAPETAVLSDEAEESADKTAEAAEEISEDAAVVQDEEVVSEEPAVVDAEPEEVSPEAAEPITDDQETSEAEVAAEASEVTAEAAEEESAEMAYEASEDMTAEGRNSAMGYTKIEPGWYNASSKVVQYYMDPRNFLNSERIYMFEDLSYRPEYQTAALVTKIISPTKLPGCGFTTKIFMDAGSVYNVSPVFLAARARQETGGGSIAISGYKYNGKVVYNPFNIGATSGSNPVMNGIKYAYNKGWTTQAKAVNGGANFLASGYINNNQHTIYFQKFNVANGAANVGSHQYMTNIQAPYHESYSVMTSYTSYGITEEALTFVIPVFNSMPAKTELP